MGSFLSSGTTDSFRYNKTDILRREGGIAKYFDLRLAGRRLGIVYAYYVESPLARGWLAAQVLSGYRRHFAAFMAVDGCLGSLHVARRPRLNFNKTKHICIPADQVDFSRLPRRAVVAGHDHIPLAPQMEAGIVLTAPAGALVRRPLVGRQSMPRQPVKAADGGVGKTAGEQDWAPEMRLSNVVVQENLLAGGKKRM
jgi:hypothetical protein